jgi:hypothetical protein
VLEELGFSETLAFFFQTVQWHIPESSNFHVDSDDDV